VGWGTRSAAYGIAVPDRQLARAPAESPEGRRYLGAMAAAANYGRANRQLLTEAARRVFSRTADAGLRLVYDVSHNLAKIETHDVGGTPTRLCVHRKGATRALPRYHASHRRSADDEHRGVRELDDLVRNASQQQAL